MYVSINNYSLNLSLPNLFSFLSKPPKVSAFFCLFSHCALLCTLLGFVSRAGQMDDDWDLQAVVRGCCATATTSPNTTTTSTASSKATRTATSSCAVEGFHSFSRFQPLRQVQESNLLCFQDLFEPRNESSSIEELCDLYKPFFNKPSSSSSSSPKTMPVSPLSVLGAFQDLSSQQQQLLQSQIQPKQLPSSSAPKSGHSTGAPNGNANTHSPRSKRRKNQMKRVCQVPAEGLSSDMWSWRKYGQKPIKGSPYPRGYYRCSTSKGCLARKQVERNRSDPSMFIVTYTAEHNHPMPTHRNSLAGSTRLKPTTSGDTNKPASTPPKSPAANLSPPAEKLESSRDEKDEIIEDDDDDFGVSDMPLDDGFFAGLDDELAGPSPVHGDCFSDHFPANGQFPWLVNNATTAAAAGGS